MKRIMMMLGVTGLLAYGAMAQATKTNRTDTTMRRQPQKRMNKTNKTNRQDVEMNNNIPNKTGVDSNLKTK